MSYDYTAAIERDEYWYLAYSLRCQRPTVKAKSGRLARASQKRQPLIPEDRIDDANLLIIIRYRPYQ